MNEAEQKTEEELRYDESYRLNHSKLVEILTQIKEKCKETDTYFCLLKDGIYISGEMDLFKMGEGSKGTTRGYIGRLVDGSLIGKADSLLYLQVCAGKGDSEVAGIEPNLVDILRQFII